MCPVLIYSVLKVHADKRKYFHINKTDKTTGFHSKRDPNVERNLLTGSLLTLNQSSDIFYAYTLLFQAVLKAGTEPKVKFYLGVKGTSLEDADAKSKALSESVHAMIGKML